MTAEAVILLDLYARHRAGLRRYLARVVGDADADDLLQGTEEQRLAAYKKTLLVLTRRIELFLNLPLEKLDRLALKERLDSIGKAEPVSSQ